MWEIHKGTLRALECKRKLICCAALTHRNVGQKQSREPKCIITKGMGRFNCVLKCRLFIDCKNRGVKKLPYKGTADDGISN